MSNNYRHIASVVRVLQDQCISMLVVEDNLLPKSALGINYHDLCLLHQNIVKAGEEGVDTTSFGPGTMLPNFKNNKNFQKIF